jgi:hypothetical protein
MSWSIFEAKESGDARLDPQVVQAAAQFFHCATTGCGHFTLDFAADLGVQALLCCRQGMLKVRFADSRWNIGGIKAVMPSLV